MTKINFLRRLIVILLFIVGFGAHAQAPQGLQVNDHAPDFTAQDQYGKKIALHDLLTKGPVVLVFYRGEWCPYCNKHLKELEDNLKQFASKGASVIAVTPEQPEYIAKTIKKTNVQFSILHDVGLKIMKSYDVAYKIDEPTLARYKKFNLDFNVINGEQNAANLPVPALYIINKKGIISYRFFDPDYKNRAPVASLIKFL